MVGISMSGPAIIGSETVTVSPNGESRNLFIDHTSDGGAMVRISSMLAQPIRVSPAVYDGECECHFRLVGGKRVYPATMGQRRYLPALDVADSVYEYLMGAWR